MQVSIFKWVFLSLGTWAFSYSSVLVFTWLDEIRTFRSYLEGKEGHHENNNNKQYKFSRRLRLVIIENFACDFIAELCILNMVLLYEIILNTKHRTCDRKILWVQVLMLLLSGWVTLGIVWSSISLFRKGGKQCICQCAILKIKGDSVYKISSIKCVIQHVLSKNWYTLIISC